MSDLKITSISIADTFGCRAVNFRPGSVTRISGGNGEGKSSILKALLYVFAGGLDPEVIRKGAERSVVSFTLSDGVTITKTTERVKPRKGADSDGPVKYKAVVTIADSDAGVIEAPASYIKDLSEALAVDPSILLRIDSTTAPGKRALALELLRLVPISFDPEEVNKAVAYRSSMDVPFAERDVIALPESPTAEMNLDGLKKVIVLITEQRRRVGQIRDDTDGTVNRLQKSLPEDDGADHAARLTELERESVTVERDLGARRLEIEEQRAEAMKVAQDARNETERAAEQEYSAAIAAAESKRTLARGSASKLFTDRKDNVLSNVADALSQIEVDGRPEQSRIADELAVTKERLASHNRAATLRTEIESQRKICQNANWKYDQLTGVLANLEALRLEKLNHLPVAGLIVEEGEAYLDGIAWDKVNLARRVEAVLQICTQRSGKLPLLIVDDAEHLDSETRRIVEEGLADAGFQLIEAVVKDGPLSIEIVESLVAA